MLKSCKNDKNELKISFFGSFSNTDKNTRAGLAPYATTEITFFRLSSNKTCCKYIVSSTVIWGSQPANNITTFHVGSVLLKKVKHVLCNI